MVKVISVENNDNVHKSHHIILLTSYKFINLILPYAGNDQSRNKKFIIEN